MKPLILLVGLALVVPQAARGLATEPTLRATANSPGDTCAATVTGDKLLVEIASERGIGRATLEATAGAFPPNITLRLRYTTGKPLPTLEGLTLTAPTFTLEGATARADDFQLTRRDNAKEADKAGQPAAKPAEKPDVEKQMLIVRATATALEIDLPKNLLGDARTFNLHWVDYYRN